MLHLVGIISLLSMMHGTTNIKFIDAQQAKLAYQYKRNCCILLELFHYSSVTRN